MKPVDALLKDRLKVVNLGLRSFYESCKAQEVPAVHMDWKPPAGGREHLMKILKKLR
jgi:FdrA protein